MKENYKDDIPYNYYNTYNNNNSYINLNNHEEKMDKMVEYSQNIAKKIKLMNQEISSELQFQNKLVNEIGLTVGKTNSELKKNNSKIDEILLKTSTFSLLISAIIQVIVIIFLLAF